MSITGYYLAQRMEENPNLTHINKIIVLNKCINAVLISHVICHVASFFF